MQQLGLGPLGWDLELSAWCLRLANNGLSKFPLPCALQVANKAVMARARQAGAGGLLQGVAITLTAVNHE